MKKLFSLLIIFALCISVFTGCTGNDPDLSYAATGTIDGEAKEFATGPYRFYVQWMNDYYYAYFKTMAAQIEKEMNWSQMLGDTSLTAPKTLSQFIIDTAKDQYMSYLYINATFDRLGLKLTQEDEAEIDRIIREDWIAVYGNDKFNTIRQTLGLTYDEFRDITACNLKSEKIVDYYYGEGGPNAISEGEMKEYYQNNYVRFKYIFLATADSDGNAYNDKKMEEVEGNRDNILSSLEADTPFEELIKQYSEDYTQITDEMTVSEKETYELQNSTQVEDGLVINNNGVFSEDLATYYNITIDASVVDKVFSLKEGEYATVSLKGSIWVVKRYSHTEKETYFDGVKETVFKALYADDLASKHTEWRSRLNYVYNEDVIEAYKPENLADLFDISSTTSR